MRVFSWPWGDKAALVREEAVGSVEVSLETGRAEVIPGSRQGVTFYPGGIQPSSGLTLAASPYIGWERWGP